MIPLALVFGLLTLASALANPVKRWPDPVVDLGYATYQGVYEEPTGIQYFLGMKYGADTSGSNRFRAPQPPSALPGIRNASIFSPECPSTDLYTTPFNRTVLTGYQDPSAFSEDCLYVNVFLPPGTRMGEDKKPVFVQLHPGGYTRQAILPVPIAEFVLTEAVDNSSIFVDVSFRLGAFGFLAGESVYENGDVNVGLLDQQAGLRWIQDNIGKFGGDPERVTIWGVSSGAGSVLHHIVANGGNTQPKLFSAAIASSPFSPPIYHYSDYVVERIYDDVASRAGCGGADDTLSCLRSLSFDQLVEVNYNITIEAVSGDYVFRPVVDGSFVTDRPTKLLEQEKLNVNKLWVEHAANEGILFNSTITFVPTINSSMPQAAYIASLFPHYNASLIETIQAYYDEATFGSLQTATEQLYGEQIFVCPSLRMADAFGSNAYLSVFAVPPDPDHSATFNIAIGLPTDLSPVGIEDYLKALAQYAGSNSFPGLPEWQRYDPSSPKYLNFNVTPDDLIEDNSFVAVDKELQRRCDFWLSIADITPQ